MALTRLNNDMYIVSKLGDNPKVDNGLSTDQFRARFDEAGIIIQSFLNNILIPELEKTVVWETIVNEQNTKIASAQKSSATALERANAAVPKSGGTMTGNLSIIPDPTADTHATNKKYVDSRIQYVSAALTAAGWGGSGPYTQAISVPGVTAEKGSHVSPVYSGVDDASIETAAACVTYASDETDVIRFVCLHAKPDVDIPIRVEVHR